MTELFRKVYRNPIIETILMLAVVVQMLTGIFLIRHHPGIRGNIFESIRFFSGIYLAVFLFIHPIAIWVGRLYLGLDTNFYYGAAGFNIFPYQSFFFPYYLFAIVSVFSHLAVVHYYKMSAYIREVDARRQSFLILAASIVVAGLIFYGFTDGFTGREIPVEYHYLLEIKS